MSEQAIASQSPEQADPAGRPTPAKPPVEIALVGCAHIHTPGFVKRLKDRIHDRHDLHVRYVWDHDAARAGKRAAELGTQAVEDLSLIWKDKAIKAVVICSETDRHKDLVLAAAKAKKHLFVEKPLGMGSADAYPMAKAVEKAGVLFQTGFFKRGEPINLFLREHIHKGTFGTITRVRGSNCHGGALGGWFDAEWRWMADPAAAGCGAFGDLGAHALDIILWLFGEVALCTASVSRGTARYGACDETGEGLLKFTNGAIATLAAAWDDVANPVSLLVSGTEGHATVIDNELYLQSKNLEGADGKEPWTKLPPAQPAGFDLFLEALMTEDHHAPLVTAREAAYRGAVMEALYEGARKSKWVKPRPFPASRAGKARVAATAGAATGSEAAPPNAAEAPIAGGPTEGV